jgi:hypothetical protein
MYKLRGTGRTTAMVRRLPNDGKPVWIMVHDYRFSEYVLELIRKVHGDYRGKVNFAVSPDMAGLRPDRVFIDHHVASQLGGPTFRFAS